MGLKTMTNDPWRYRCPEGHSSWEQRANGKYYCPWCDDVFDELVDWKMRESDEYDA